MTIDSHGDQSEPTQVRDVLDRAIIDSAFRSLLISDPDMALAGYNLTEVQVLLLRSLDESDLDKLTPENLDEYFSVDSVVYTPDDAHMVQQGYEIYAADDFGE